MLFPQLDKVWYIFLSLLYKSLLWKPQVKSVSSSHDILPFFLILGHSHSSRHSSVRTSVQVVLSCRNSLPSVICLADSFLPFKSPNHFQIFAWFLPVCHSGFSFSILNETLIAQSKFRTSTPHPHPITLLILSIALLLSRFYVYVLVYMFMICYFP